jgi:hypothetical protein
MIHQCGIKVTWEVTPNQLVNHYWYFEDIQGLCIDDQSEQSWVTWRRRRKPYYLRNDCNCLPYKRSSGNFYRYYERAYGLHLQGSLRKIKSLINFFFSFFLFVYIKTFVSSSFTSVINYQSRRRHIPEDKSSRLRQVQLLGRFWGSETMITQRWLGFDTSAVTFHEHHHIQSFIKHWSYTVLVAASTNEKLKLTRKNMNVDCSKM